jgi:hypothetical protein
VSIGGTAVSNQNYLSSRATRDNAGTVDEILHLSKLTPCHECVGGICFANK